MLYNPIGLVDPRYSRPWESTDEGYKRTLATTYQTIRASIMRYVAHNEAAWTPEFETYTRIRYAWTLGADWPRLAMVQTLIGQVQYLDPVVDDWAHIKAPTLVFGGAEDSLPGSAALFKERMKFVAESIPNGNGRLHLIPGLGHVPHMEAPDKTFPPLVAFLKEGCGSPGLGAQESLGARRRPESPAYGVVVLLTFGDRGIGVRDRKHIVVGTGEPCRRE